MPGLWSTWIDRDHSHANQKILDWVVHSEIEHVILAARWSVLTDGANTGPASERLGSLVSPVGSSHTASNDQATEFLSDGLSSLIDTLEDSGITVWILAEVPLQRDSPQQRGIKSWLGKKPLPLRGVTRMEHLAHVHRSMDAIRNASSANTRLVDLSIPFFDEDDLSIIAASDGTSYYSDDDHVNMIGARVLLTPVFREILGDISRDIAKGN